MTRKGWLGVLVVLIGCAGPGPEEEGTGGAPPVCVDEVCNGVDDDCDGLVDDADDTVTGQPTWYVDGDGDGSGHDDRTVLACGAGPGRADAGGDCDDADPARDGADRDGDGTSTCEADCDDADAARGPLDGDGDGASSCDGDCDDGDRLLNLRDADGDGITSCGGDCDDQEPRLGLGCLNAGSADVQITGTAADTALWGSAALLDLDGDGAIDLLAQSAGRPGGPVNAGGVHLFAGPLDQDRDTSTADALFHGDEAQELAGTHIEAIGDIDDDGFADLAISVPHTSSRDGYTHLVYGGPARPSGDIDLATLPGWTLRADNAWYTYDVPRPHRLGDTDGDGWTDYALSHGTNIVNGSEVGEVFVVYGDGTRLTGMNAAAAETVWTGAVATGGRVGSDLGAGDYDGDGLADVVMGAEQMWDRAADLQGGAYLAYGAPDRASTPIAGTDADAYFGGTFWTGWYGSVVHDGADLDGDGFDEIVIHEPYASDTLEGRLWIYRGGPTRWSGEQDGAAAAWLSIAGFADTDGFGASVATGDFSGDGVTDLAVAAPGILDGRGAIYLFHGPLAGGALTHADADLLLVGATSGDRLGTSVLAGDVDGSGRTDLVAAAPGQGFGAIVVFFDPTP